MPKTIQIILKYLKDNIKLKNVLILFIILLLISIIPFQSLLIHDIVKINKHQYTHINNLYKQINILRANQLRNQRDFLFNKVTAHNIKIRQNEQDDINYTMALVMNSVMTEVKRHDIWRK